MKKILKSLAVAAGVLVAAVGCNQDQIGTYFDGGERSDVAYFETSSYNYTYAEGATGEQTFTIQMKRYKVDGSASLNLNVEYPDGGASFFEIPSTVTFADGEYFAEIPVRVSDVTNLAFETPYKAKISVLLPDDFNSMLGNPTSISFSATRAAGWVDLGMATITDDLMTGLYGNDIGWPSWEVPIQENEAIAGFYRLVNPYGEAYPYNDPGDYDESKDYYWPIHAEDPDGVWMPLTALGFDWGYGQFIFGSMGAYYMDAGNSFEVVKNAGYMGKLVDGVISFPVNGMVVTDEEDYPNLWYGNTNGKFTIVLP